MRVLIMLYMPWFDEKKEVEVANLLRVLEANRHEIVVNRAKFESIVSENFDKAQEEIEKEINEFYEQLMENEVQQLDDASDNLARNFIHDGSIRDMNDEEAEENFGYQAALFDEVNVLQRAANDQSDKFDCLNLPKELSKEEYTGTM
ncbi:hypothetical protein BpHYR1_034536, partial [Brachionus plicatilis]